MALESWMYADPEKVAIRKEEESIRKARACGKCRHKVTVVWKGDDYHGCEFKRRKYGTRCELYKEKK